LYVYRLFFLSECPLASFLSECPLASYQNIRSLSRPCARRRPLDIERRRVGLSAARPIPFTLPKRISTRAPVLPALVHRLFLSSHPLENDNNTS
jgi:hypothetical protein